MDDNNKTFSYLHSVLTDTGDSLVINIIKYFTWLGFKDIRNMDEFLKDKKEEDIQIQLSNGLLIIEAKGIGGTSKDEECSQISKIRSRRCEERNTFDVIALYIVNHQRHIPPLERKNPPFSEDQIRDAVLNKRNLLTTWTLYNAHFDIINGFISKQRVIECLLKPGLVEFLPDRIVELNTVKEVFLNGEVIIIDLIENSLNSNDTLAYKDGFRFVLIRILSIQVNAQDVAKAENCEVGIKINSKIKKGTKIFKCVQAD
jgi:hypothetical protein